MTARVRSTSRTAPGGGVRNFSPRLAAALLGGKTAAVASRLLGRGGGTSLPGMVARRIHTGVLAEIVGRRGLPVVAITGSNGKTTIARLTAALIRGEGLSVAQNSAGSNLIQGVTSLAVISADLRGRIPETVFVAEVDEGALPLVAPEIQPRVLLVADLFRDQLDRFGEIYAVADAIASVAEALPPDSTLVVNADDPMLAGMAATREGPVLTFGLAVDRSLDAITSAADTIRCPRCRSDLSYARVYLGHLGDYACPRCGFSRPPLDVAVTALEVQGLDATRATIQTPAGEVVLTVPQAGVHVAYNAAAALAVTAALGLETPHALESLAGVAPAFGRLEQIPAGVHTIVLAFAKNPTSFNTTLRTLRQAGEPRHLLIAASNTLVDGEDFGWLWDVDFEGAAVALERVTVSGLRADELATRLKYAGVPEARMSIEIERARALDVALADTPPEAPLVVLAGYTPTIELREAMRRRGWVGRYWRQ